jgi:hypothetical protein
MSQSNRDHVARYVIVHEESNRVVAECGGTHHMLERICARLDERRPGTYFYDDASERRRYGAQVGPNIALSVR